MTTFYYNAMAVAGSQNDVDRFLEDVGIPKEVVGQNEGTDVREFDGENERLNGERYKHFNTIAKDCAGIYVDRVRTEWQKSGVRIRFDSWGWHGGELCSAFGPSYPQMKFLIPFFNDTHGGMVLRVRDSIWEAWKWTNGGGPEEKDDYRCLGYGTLSCFGDHIWDRIGRPGEAPEVSDEIPSPGMTLLNGTGDFFGEQFQDDAPRTATFPD